MLSRQRGLMSVVQMIVGLVLMVVVVYATLKVQSMTDEVRH